MNQAPLHYCLTKLAMTLDYPSVKLDRSITPVVSRISKACSHNHHNWLCNDSHCICDCHNRLEKERAYVKKSIGIYTLNLPLIVTGNLEVDAVKWMSCFKCGAIAGEPCKTPSNKPAKKIHSWGHPLQQDVERYQRFELAKLDFSGY